MVKKEEIVEELYKILNRLNGVPECLPWPIRTDLLTAKKKIKGLIKVLK